MDAPDDPEAILSGKARMLPPAMSEEDMEDFLTEAIGLYCESTGTSLASLATFSESRLLLKNRGLVVRLGRDEFRITIVKSGA
jgi:hypothetical protein